MPEYLGSMQPISMIQWTSTNSPGLGFEHVRQRRDGCSRARLAAFYQGASASSDLVGRAGSRQRSTHDDSSFSNAPTASSHQLTRAAVRAASSDIGKSSTPRHAQTLCAHTKPIPAIPGSQDSSVIPATTESAASTTPTLAIPLEVLAKTCDSLPHCSHLAGISRHDQRTARSRRPEA